MYHLDCTEASKEGDDCDESSNNDDDVSSRGVETDVKITRKVWYLRLRLLEQIQEARFVDENPDTAS